MLELSSVDKGGEVKLMGGGGQDTPGADFSVCGALLLPWMAHTSTHSDGHSALPGLGEVKPERSLQLTNLSTPPPFPYTRMAQVHIRGMVGLKVA